MFSGKLPKFVYSFHVILYFKHAEERISYWDPIDPVSVQK